MLDLQRQREQESFISCIGANAHPHAHSASVAGARQRSDSFFSCGEDVYARSFTEAERERIDSRIHQEENEPFDFALVFQHPFLPDDPKKRSKKHNPKVEASKIKKWAKRAFPFVPFPLNGDGSIVERQPSQAEGRPADGQQETGGGYAIGPHGTVELDCGSVSPWYGRDWTEWIEEHRGGAPLDEVIETMRQVTVSALLRLGFEVRVVDAHDLEETFVKVRMPDKLCASAAERFSYRCQMAPSVCRDAFPFCSRASYFPPFFPFDRAAEKGKFWWCRQPSADANANEEREGNPSGEGGKQTGGESDDGRGERDAATVGGKMLWQRHDTEGHPIPLHFGEEQLDAQHFRGAYGSQLYSRASSIGGVGGGTTRWGGGGESLAATGRVGARELSPTSPPFDELVRYQEHPRHSLTGGSVSMREGRVSRVDLEENSAVDGRETLLNRTRDRADSHRRASLSLQDRRAGEPQSQEETQTAVGVELPIGPGDGDGEGEGGYREGSIWRPVDRMRLSARLLQHYVALQRMVDDGVLLDVVYLHQPGMNQKMRIRWGSCKPRILKSTQQPLDDIRTYFGEEIAFYFAWAGYYTRQLSVPAAVGLIATVLQAIDYLRDGQQGWLTEVVILIQCVLTAVWTAWFAEQWPRKAQKTAYRWGLGHSNSGSGTAAGTGGQETAVDPEWHNFQPDRVEVSEINPNVLVRRYSKRKRMIRLLASNAVTSLFVLVNCVCVFGIFFCRGWVKENADRLRPFFEKHGLPTYVLEDPTTIMSLANAVQIKIFDLIWSAVAPVLTAFENHKLESQYRESLVVKVFLFKFINSFNSLFYIALLKDIVEQEDSGCEGPAEGAGGSRSCLSYLTTQLASIFVVNLAFNAFEIGAPLLSYALKVRRERTAEGGLAVLSRVEKQYKMEKYDSTTDDFMELVIQFGLVAFFSIALPVIPFLAWLMNLLEIRIDAFKLLYCYQRPFPSRSREEGIGAWQNIIRTMAAISCIVNIGLPLFNLRLFSNMSDASRLITFLVAENAVLMARGAVALASSSDMDEIERVRGRHSAVVQLALFGPSKEKDGPARQPSLPGAAAGLSAFRRGGSSLKQGGEDQDGNDNPSPSRGEGGDGRRGQQGPQTGGFVVVEGTFGGSRLVTEGPRQPVEEGQTTEGLGVPFGELPAPRLVTRLD